MIGWESKVALEINNKNEINNIFEKILQENSHFMKRINQCLNDTKQHKDDETSKKNLMDFKKQLINYRDLLIEENYFLLKQNSSTNHPLQVAHALQVLNDPEEDSNFSENVARFCNEASDSKFRPKVTAAAVFIGAFLLFAVVGLVICGIAVMFIPVVIPDVIMAAVVAPLIIAMYLGLRTKMKFRPIDDSTNTGSAIGSFF